MIMSDRDTRKKDVIHYDLYDARKRYRVSMLCLTKKLNISRFILASMEAKQEFPRNYYEEFSQKLPIMFPAELLNQEEL